MDTVLVPLVQMVGVVIDLYVWVLIVGVILSWLTAFGIVNTHNRVVYLVGDFVYRVTEPLLAPLRRVLPNFGNVDLSPLALILLLYFAKNVLFNITAKLL